MCNSCMVNVQHLCIREKCGKGNRIFLFYMRYTGVDLGGREGCMPPFH